MGLFMGCSKGIVVLLMIHLGMCFLYLNHILCVCVRKPFYHELIVDDALVMRHSAQG